MSKCTSITGGDTRDMLLRTLDDFTIEKWQEGISVGRMSERERIIELLESQDCHYSTYKKPCECGAFMVEQIDYLVSLIRGEE